MHRPQDICTVSGFQLAKGTQLIRHLKKKWGKEDRNYKYDRFEIKK